MWENITSGDIEQAKHSLNLRRAETLSRHAEELKVLDTEQSEVDNLTSAIEAFISKYRGSGPSDVAPASVEEASSPAAENENMNQDESGQQRTAGPYGLNFRSF